MAISQSIRPAVVRGSLVHQVADVQFPGLTQAICAASAVQALQDLQQQRTVALARMRANARNVEAFAAAAKEEAELAFQIRRLKREGSTEARS